MARIKYFCLKCNCILKLVLSYFWPGITWKYNWCRFLKKSVLWIILIELGSCYQVATCSCTWLTQIVDRLKCLRGIMRVNIYCTRKPWVKIKQYTCNTYQNYSIRHLAHAEYEHWLLGTDTLESIPPGLLGTFWKKYKVDTGSTYLLTY